MALNKVTYVDGQTVIYAQNLNDIQDEVIANAGEIADLADEKVDKVSGKQLSTEDYSSAEKSKLAGIQAGAQVNPGNATTAAAGLMSAEDKAKLDDIGIESLQESVVATTEEGTTASQAYEIGDYIWWSDSLYRVILPIASGDTFSDSSSTPNVTKASVADDLRRCDKTLDTQINSLHNLINYGYDNPVNVIGTGTISKKIRNGTRLCVSINLNSSASTAYKFVVSAPAVPTLTTNVTSQYVVKGLIDGHTYRARVHYVSGTSDHPFYPYIHAYQTASPNIAVRSTDPITGDEIGDFTYSSTAYPDGVYLSAGISRSGGLHATDYTVDITLEDITNGCMEDAFSNVAPLEAETASADYAVGDLLVYKSKLYEVTAAIATGETLVPGTNISETTVNDKLDEKADNSDVDAVANQLDPEMMVTRNLYIQNGTTNANYKTVTINNGFISVSVGSGVTTNYCTIFITNEFSSTFGTNQANTVPPINSVLPIAKLRNLNYIKTYAESNVTTAGALSLAIHWCSVENDTVTKLSYQSINLTTASGENVLRTTKLEIPEGATHYALAVYHSNKNDVAGKSATARIKFCYLPEAEA